MSKGNVLLGICGGIAAYKIPGLVSLLVQQGYSVRIVLSEAGAHFVSREALEVISNQKVYSSLSRSYEEPLYQPQPNASPVLHIALIDEADIFLVAPASYNWIGKAACGIADDLLGTLFAAWPMGNGRRRASPATKRKPILFAPTMNPEMWYKQVLQQNIASLQQQGCELIEPNQGFLACRASGPGRMAEAEQLYYHVESRLRFKQHPLTQEQGLPLAGKKLLISAGPTREALDPVRYISNRSSGKTGIALACAARDLGAEVTLISSIEPHSFDNPMHDPLAWQLFNIHIVQCNSAAEMAEHASHHFAACDWALAVAAVCDFRPAQYHSSKLKKCEGKQNYSLELVPTSDILACWGQHKTPTQKVLGFALEDEHPGQRQVNEPPVAHALAKLHNKRADAIVLNSPKNLEGNQAWGKLILVPMMQTSPTGKEPGIARNKQMLQYDLSLQDKRDFAAELLLLLHQHWQ